MLLFGGIFVDKKKGKIDFFGVSILLKKEYTITLNSLNVLFFSVLSVIIYSLGMSFYYGFSNNANIKTPSMVDIIFSTNNHNFASVISVGIVIFIFMVLLAYRVYMTLSYEKIVKKVKSYFVLVIIIVIYSYLIIITAYEDIDINYSTFPYVIYTITKFVISLFIMMLVAKYLIGKNRNVVVAICFLLLTILLFFLGFKICNISTVSYLSYQLSFEELNSQIYVSCLSFVMYFLLLLLENFVYNILSNKKNMKVNKSRNLIAINDANIKLSHCINFVMVIFIGGYYIFMNIMLIYYYIGQFFKLVNP
jgi:hypothetical protein